MDGWNNYYFPIREAYFQGDVLVSGRVLFVFFSGRQEGYELSTPDHMIYFWGSFDHHAVNITDEVAGPVRWINGCGSRYHQIRNESENQEKFSGEN